MAKTLAIIEVPQPLTKKQLKLVRKAAEKRLGADYRIMVMCGGATCNIIPSFGK